MSTDTTANFENDGSLAHAALEMPDIDGLDDPSPGNTRTEIIDPREAANRRATSPVEQPRQNTRQNRQDDGKYAEGFDTAILSNLPPEAAEQDDKADIDASAPDEEWFELPPEKEGDKPRRIKADEVWQGYQERETYREQLEQVSRIVPPPPQYDEEIYRTVQVRNRMVQELDQIIAANQPIDPDMRLIDENSPHYNPGEFHRQVAFQREQAGRINQLQQRRAHEATQLQQEAEALTAARKAREQSKLVQFWPELRDPTVQRQVRDDAARYFGITDDDFKNVLDARFYAMLKVALDNINGQKQRQQTVKVVRAKPKMVRGSARDSNPKTAQYQTGMRAVQRSGSIEDAADAIGALI
jgi:hypothetical protein